MSKYIVYNTNIGNIIKSVSAPTVASAMQEANYPEEDILPLTANDVLQYVDINTLTVVDKIPIPYVLNMLEISNLPISTTLVILGTEYLINDGIALLSFDEPGEYLVVLKHAIYLDTEVTINAN